jgi:hypothetical protein
MNRPERVRLRTVFIYSLFLVGFLVLFGQIKSTANLYDEGLVLTNAERIRAGELPYRDFWTMYGPGYFYALAGLFSLVEPTVLAARLFDTALRFLLTLKVYLLARSLTSSWVAFIPYAFVTYWLATIRFYSYPAFPATGALLLSALAFRRYLWGGGRRWLFLTGMALGLAALLRLDFGGYGAMGYSFALVLFELRTSGAAGGTSRTRSASVLKSVLLMAGGALLVALPLYSYLILASGFDTVYNVLIAFPATVFRAVRHLPVPPLVPDWGRLTGAQWNDWLRLYIPLGVYATAAVISLRWLFSLPLSPSDPRIPMGALFLALTGTGLGLVVKATSRYHELHAIPATICALILSTALIYRIPRRYWRSAPFQLGFAGLAFLFLTGPYVVHFHILAARRMTSALVCYSELPRAGCVSVDQDAEQVVTYLHANTRPDEYIFVGNSRHDLIFVNDLLLYFLAGRRSPTPYAELHPGLATTLPVQSRITNDLMEKDVQWAVIMQVWTSNEPNASSTSSGVTFLDDYIQKHYEPEATFGKYEVWRRRP